MDLNTPLSALSGVGEKIGARLKIIGLETVNDLLLYFPFRYDDFSKTIAIKNLVPDEKANILGQIELLQNRRAHRRRMYITEALISDETESIKVIWFNQPFITKTLKVGDNISLSGKVQDDNGIITMVSPVYEKIGYGKLAHTQGLVPHYHLTENLTQKQIRFLVKQIISIAEKLPDILPEEIRKKLKLLSYSEAIKKINFPNNQLEADEARRRLAFNELFLLQIRSLIIRKEKEKSKAESLEFKAKATQEFVASLPFKLTDDQRKTAWVILKDLEKSRPMTRLLNGDVGSGKTLVAVIAILNTVLNNKQSALLAPTEILAWQHFNTISKLLSAFPIKIALFTNNYRVLNNTTNEKISRLEMLKIIKNGEADIIIGTHALLSEDVIFKNLALAIIDEQHRFGVEQRKILTLKSGHPSLTPHLLSMTATPIPRSLALSIFGDLDISFIKQMPSGRQPIMTKIVPETKRQAAYDFIKKEIAKGRQIFVVCPLIEESDFFGAKAVEEEFKKLDKEIFPDLPVAKLHGRLKSKEKEKIMRDFLDKKYKILISTSVIEVGVDIPNASIMLIEGADRFGLAQLHQFRGRVGRGNDQAYCFLFTDSLEEKTKKRLEALEKYNSGFDLAEIDLKLRGSGEIFGLAQSGFPELKIATLFDYALMKEAKEEAETLIKLDPELKNHKNLSLAINLENKIHLE